MAFIEQYNAFKKCIITDYPYDLVWEDKMIEPVFMAVFKSLLCQHSRIKNSYYSIENNGQVKLDYMDHYVILCFRFANECWKLGLKDIADAVYYSSRIRGSIDLFYTTNIGLYFMPVHAIGTVIDSHSVYGKVFKIYNECHIGPYDIIGKDPKDWKHPIIGNYVTLLSGTKVFGETVIGNNVVTSVNTIIINEEIPDNCIVSGQSPNLVFRKLKTLNSSILKDTDL